MSISVQPVKATILGGLVFLVPVTIVVVIIAKVFAFMSVLAAPFAAWIPVDSVGGVATANIITVVAILLICFIAGRIAISGVGRRLYALLDDKLLTLFPRYAFIKGMTDSMNTDEEKTTLQPVLIKLDDQSQIGFEVERAGNQVAVYLPGSPDPWSGMLAYVEAKRIENLDANFNDVISSLRKAGQGAGALLG